MQTPARETDDANPSDAVLFSIYLQRRGYEAPTDSAGNSLLAATFVMRSELLPQAAVRLVDVMALSAPSIEATAFARDAAPTKDGMRVMAVVTMQRLESEWGEHWFRDHRGLVSFDQMAQGIFRIESDSRLLDVAGAWLDAYARIPGIPWLSEKESSFAAALDKILQGSSFARRDREIVLRKDVGTAPILEEPLRQFLANRPEYRNIELRLRDAQDELDQGNAADAVTDIGAALQLALRHLGHDGKTLGEQVVAARKAGRFSGVNSPLGEAMEKLCAWVSSVRNQQSDAHPGAPIDLDEAKLTFRVTVSLILFWLGG